MRFAGNCAICQAQQPSVHLDRHERKIQKVLAACPVGSHVHLIMRDQPDQFGYLGDLSAQSFELLDPVDHTPHILAYDQVDRIGCESRVSENGFYHRRNSTGFLIIIGVAVGVSVAILATSRD